MKKGLLTIFLVVTSLTLLAQIDMPDENLTIALKKGKKVGVMSNGTASVGKGNIKAMAQIEFKSSDPDKKRKIDLNKFSLVDHTTKKRYRGVDVAYGHPLGYKPGIRLTKKDITTASLSVRHDEEVVDTFEDYSLEGYKNIERKTKLAIGKKYSSVTYYLPIDRTIKRIQLFFAVPKSLKGKEVDIYYGTEKVGTFKI